MYLKHWELRAPPFLNVPDGAVFFPSPHHEEAMHRLSYVVQHRKGVAMISGEVGCGKSTLVRALEHFLPKNAYAILHISNPALDPVDMIRAVLLKIGDPAAGASKMLLLDRLQRLLETRSEQKIETVLVVDEAHMITENATLDEIRMLLNLQSGDRALLTIILLGQPPLLKKLSQLHPLDERINMRIHLKPLDLFNTGKYIMFRLKRAGALHGIFSREAVAEVYRFSAGIPLRINNVCDRSLLIGLMHKSRLVNAKMVREALMDLA